VGFENVEYNTLFSEYFPEEDKKKIESPDIYAHINLQQWEKNEYYFTPGRLII